MLLTCGQRESILQGSVGKEISIANMEVSMDAP